MENAGRNWTMSHTILTYWRWCLRFWHRSLYTRTSATPSPELMPNRLTQFFRRIPLAALLPLLACRALIPVGLMPVTGADGALSLQLCPGTFSAAAGHVRQTSSAEDRGSTHDHHDGTGGPASSHQTVCPFAVLTTPACTATVHTFATRTMRYALVASREPAEVYLPTISRPQSPRAPPRQV